MRSAVLLILSWTGSMLMFASAGAQAGREQVHVEMVETLEAYAVYKMGRYDEAFQAWLALAQKGNAQGILNVANMYLAGEGVVREPQKAVDWYMKGTEQGDPHCLLNLAKAYEAGIGVTADPAAAEDYYGRAAGAGSTEAQVRIAKRLIASGSPASARSWLERAAENGDQDALALLARLDPGPADVAISVSPDDRRRVEDLLHDMDAAANARDADWLTKAVSEEADIKVRLPGQPELKKLSKTEYRTLWELTFRNTERYRFARNEYRFASKGGGLRLHSRIREYLTSNSRTEQLIIEETLDFAIDALVPPVIERVTLIVKRAR